MNIQDIKKEIDSADMVLVGIGAELSANKIFPYDSKEIINFYEKFGMKQYETVVKESEQKKEMEYLRDLYYFYYIRTHKIATLYDQLAECLSDKNYFIITSNTDDLIYSSKLEEEKIVSPCGTRAYFQCSVGCNRSLYSAEALMLAKIKEYEETGETSQIACGQCKKPLEFNVRTKESAAHYVEEGYLEQWEAYTKWLQRTLNKKVLVLELGEGFEQPSLFHWPFERLVYFNQKAKLVRVHKKLSQVGEELKERGLSIPISSVDFLNGKE